MSDTYSQLLYHLVWSTQNRARCLGPTWRDGLYRYIGGTVRGLGGNLLSAGGVEDHIHLLVSLPPSRSVSDVVREIKTASNRWIADGGHVAGRFRWQAGYGAFSVSPSQVDAVSEYIASQAEHHRFRSFREELIALLVKHAVEFEERFVE